MTLHAPSAPLDGVEFSTEDPEVIAQRTMEIQAQQKRDADSGLPALEAEQDERAAAENNDWMLRDYAARLKQEGLAKTADSDPTTFAQPTTSSATATSTDSSIDPLLNPPTPSRTPAQPPVDNQAKPEISVADLTSSESVTSLQPLLPPLDAPPLKIPSHDPWDSNTIAAAKVDIILPPSSSNETSHTDSSLDFPGLTAAQSGLGGGSASTDVSLQDPLPEESEQQKKLDNQNNFLPPTAPTGEVSEFLKKQAKGLQAPTAPTVAQAPNAPTIVVQAPQPAEPIAKPAVSGLRSHVDDPFDILRQ